MITSLFHHLSKHKIMNRLIYKILLVLPLFLCLAQTTLAQGPGSPPATPIDGGLSLLLVAGGLYGVKKLHRGMKN